MINGLGVLTHTHNFDFTKVCVQFYSFNRSKKGKAEKDTYSIQDGWNLGTIGVHSSVLPTVISFRVGVFKNKIDNISSTALKVE